MTIQTISKSLLAGAAVLSLVACSSGSKSMPDFMVNPPKEEGKIFGSGEAEKNTFQLAKEAADTRACRDVGRVLDQRVKSVLKDFMSESGADVNSAEVLEFVESTSKSVTDVQMAGCTIDKREHKEGDAHKVYSLAVYDLSASKQLVKDMAHKNLATKEALYNRLRADQAFEKLDAELDKLK